MNSKVTTIARYILGLIFTVFGLNGFLNFLPMPPMPEAAGQFMGALAATGYFFPVLKGAEVIGGIMLLANRFVPLALLILAPISLQIILFHLFLAPAGLAVPVLILVTGVLTALGHKQVFAAVLKAKG